MNKNAFLLTEALLTLLILSLCSLLLVQAVMFLSDQNGWRIDEKIEKKWFYDA